MSTELQQQEAKDEAARLTRNAADVAKAKAKADAEAAKAKAEEDAANAAEQAQNA